MHQTLIFALGAFLAFLFTGVAGGRATFHEKLALAHLKDTNDLEIGSSAWHDFLLRARRAELAESRWTTAGMLGLVATVILLAAAIASLVA